MGFYIRKGVKVGPLRFNLSKSGIGVSSGITGLRVGTGPSGNYIHMGRGGLYYRKRLPLTPKKNSNHASNRSPGPEEFDCVIPPSDSHEVLQEIESADVAEMVDSSSEDLIAEINERRRKLRLWPVTLLAGAGISLYLYFTSAPTWHVLIAVAVSVACIYLAMYRDALAKSVVILYDIEDEYQSVYENLHIAFGLMTACKGRWHMEAEGRVKDKKYHAGADTVVRRKPIHLTSSNPPYVKTNVDTPSIPVGRQTLYFFPDKVLIFDESGVGGVSYENMSIDISAQRFIEDGSVPSDAKVVGHTWKYVNKMGGPDKRFKDNRQIPIALYEDIQFRSKSGLNERIELSRTGVADGFAAAIKGVGNANRYFS